jgi:hypothetical protein
MLSRNAVIASFSVTMRISASHRRGEEPEIELQPWLELRGALEEPVKGTTEIRISNYPREPLSVGTARPAAVGAIIGMKPEMSIVLTWSNAEFDRMWTFALSGHLKFAHLHFTVPRYGSGLVVNASFSNERDE